MMVVIMEVKPMSRRTLPTTHRMLTKVNNPATRWKMEGPFSPLNSVVAGKREERTGRKK